MCRHWWKKSSSEDQNKIVWSSNNHARKNQNNFNRNRGPNREQFRQAVNRAKNRIVAKGNSFRRTEFIANPPPIATQNVPSKPKPLFGHLNAFTVNPLSHYRIPHHPLAVTVKAQPPKGAHSTKSNKSHAPSSTIESASICTPLSVNLSRTQIKNRNRRIANKRLRQQFQQLQQQKEHQAK